MFQRIALGLIALALAGAEIARPTQFAPKRVSRTAFGIVARPIDRLELDDLPPVTQPALGNVDAVFLLAGGRPTLLAAGGTVPRGTALQIDGWCADPRALAPGVALLALVDGGRRIDVSAAYRKPRYDVAATLKAPALRDTGFAVVLPAAGFEPGAHEVRLAVVMADGRAIAEFPTPVRFRRAP